MKKIQPRMVKTNSQPESGNDAHVCSNKLTLPLDKCARFAKKESRCTSGSLSNNFETMKNGTNLSSLNPPTSQPLPLNFHRDRFLFKTRRRSSVTSEPAIAMEDELQQQAQHHPKDANFDRRSSVSSLDSLPTQLSLPCCSNPISCVSYSSRNDRRDSDQNQRRRSSSSLVTNLMSHDGSISATDSLLVCEIYGLSMLCGRCRTCIIRTLLNTCDNWFAEHMSPIQQCQYLSRLLKAAPLSFLPYANVLISPLVNRDVLYSINNRTSATQDARQALALSYLQRQSKGTQAIACPSRNYSDTEENEVSVRRISHKSDPYDAYLSMSLGSFPQRIQQQQLDCKYFNCNDNMHSPPYTNPTTSSNTKQNHAYAWRSTKSISPTQSYDRQLLKADCQREFQKEFSKGCIVCKTDSFMPHHWTTYPTTVIKETKQIYPRFSKSKSQSSVTRKKSPSQLYDHRIASFANRRQRFSTPTLIYTNELNSTRRPATTDGCCFSNNPDRPTTRNSHTQSIKQNLPFTQKRQSSQQVEIKMNRTAAFCKHATERNGSGYSNSTIHCQDKVDHDNDGNISNSNSPNDGYEAAAMLEWFATATNWHRLVVLRHLLTFCDVRTIKPVLDFVLAKCSSPSRGGKNHEVITCDNRCDIITLLPSPIAKYILSFLDFSDLQRIKQLSKTWAELAKQVLDDQVHRQDVRDLIMDLQRTSSEQQFSVPVDIPYETPEGPTTLHLIEKNAFCGPSTIIMCDGMDAFRTAAYAGGSIVVTGSNDKMLKFYDLNTGRLFAKVGGHAGSIYSISVSPRFGLVLTGSYDSSARLWSLETRKCLGILQGHKCTVSAVHIDDKTGVAVTGSKDKRFILWDAPTRTMIRSFSTLSAVTSAYVSDGYACCGMQDGEVFIIGVKQQRKLKAMNIHHGSVLAINVTEHFAVTGGKDRMAYLWSVQACTSDPLVAFRHVGAVTSAHVLFCRTITGSDDGKVRIWNNSDGTCIKIFRGNSASRPIRQLCMYKDTVMIVNTNTTIHFQIFTKEDEDISQDIPMSLQRNSLCAGISEPHTTVRVNLQQQQPVSSRRSTDVSDIFHEELKRPPSQFARNLSLDSTEKNSTIKRDPPEENCGRSSQPISRTVSRQQSRQSKQNAWILHRQKNSENKFSLSSLLENENTPQFLPKCQLERSTISSCTISSAHTRPHTSHGFCDTRSPSLLTQSANTAPSNLSMSYSTASLQQALHDLYHPTNKSSINDKHPSKSPQHPCKHTTPSTTKSEEFISTEKNMPLRDYRFGRQFAGQWRTLLRQPALGGSLQRHPS